MTAPTSPPTPVRRSDHVDVLHGHRVADPYRWLEAGVGDDEVAAFVADQAAAARAHLDALDTRAGFRTRLAELWNHPKAGPPWRRGTWWFQLRQAGDQDQQVLVGAPGGTSVPPADDAWRVLLDPNTWSDDGTASLSGLAVTDDGARVAFARSEAGSDWATWRVLATADAEVLADEIPWARFSSAAWLPDGEAFVYGAYPAPDPDRAHDAPAGAQQLRRHVVGTDAATDTVVHARPDDPQLLFRPEVSHDGRWLVVTAARGTHPTNQIHLAPITDGTIGPIEALLDAEDARYDVLGLLAGTDRDEVVVVTDLDAPNGRIIAMDLADPSVHRVLVAEGTDRLLDARLVGAADADAAGWLVVHTLAHATSRLTAIDARTGRRRHVIALPGPGTVEQLSGARHDRAIHFTYATFDRPTRVLRHELTSRADVGACDAPLPVRPSDPVGLGGVVAAEPDDVGSPGGLLVSQVAVEHDGVAVPLFLIHRRDVAPTGAVPTVLWGYGGFDIPVTPAHRPGWRAWVEAGGLLAVACLRGGGEYGRRWHDDGRLANKQHVFDDALACAAWLTGRDRDRVRARVLAAPDGVDVDPDAVWSAPAHLGIEGRSNGGLLVGACLTQAPEAFGSAVPEVGVLDLTRFHRFTIGWAWTSDYGDPEDPDDLEVLLRYSPYHRVAEGTTYPPTLITTADTDDRVVPLHSFKFAAALQHAQAGAAPVLLRVDIAAGHGAGKPLGKLLDERADVLAFHAHHLGLEPRDR